MYSYENSSVIVSKRSVRPVISEYREARFETDRLLMHSGRAPGPRGDEVGTIARVPASGGG